MLLWIVSSILTLIAAVLAYLAWVLIHRTRGAFFDSDGVQIHYTDEGSGVPVILVHGLAVNADINWRAPRITGRLARRFRVIAIDARGHGLSGKPQTPEHYGEEMVRDVVRLMDHLKIAKAHVAGYSMGGFITLKLITMFPDRLISAAICGAGWGKPDEETLPLLASLQESIVERKSIAPLIVRLEPGGAPPRWKLLIADRAVCRFNDMTAIGHVIGGFRAFEVEEHELAANKVPVLVIAGTRDPLKEYADRLKGYLPFQEIVEVAGGDHGTTMVKPQFYRGIESFFLRHSPARA